MKLLPDVGLKAWKPRDLLAGKAIAVAMGEALEPPASVAASTDNAAFWSEAERVTAAGARQQDEGAAQHSLTRIVGALSQTRLGRELLEAAHRSDVDICTTDALPVGGFYSKGARAAFINLRIVDEALGTVVVARQLSRARQVSQGMPGPEQGLSPAAHVLASRVAEATAAAHGCQVAWELKAQRGVNAVWQAAQAEPGERELAETFAQAAAETGAVEDGHALRAAYDGWFSLAGVVRSDNVVRRFHDAETPVGQMEVEESRLQAVGVMPGGLNFLALEGMPGPANEAYAAVHGETALWLRQLASRAANTSSAAVGIQATERQQAAPGRVQQSWG